MSATTTSGSNCVPAQSSSSAGASSADRAARYGRSVVIASSLRVDALVENPLTGSVLVVPVGVHTGAKGWHPSLPGLVLADVLSPLGEDGELAVAFRFRPVGLGAAWQIDDVYVDPFRNR